MDNEDLGLLAICLICCAFAFLFGYIYGSDKQMVTDRNAVCEATKNNTDQYLECTKKNPTKIYEELKNANLPR